MMAQTKKCTYIIFLKKLYRCIGIFEWQYLWCSFIIYLVIFERQYTYIVLVVYTNNIKSVLSILKRNINFYLPHKSTYTLFIWHQCVKFNEFIFQTKQKQCICVLYLFTFYTIVIFECYKKKYGVISDILKYVDQTIQVFLYIVGPNWNRLI